MIQRFSAQEWEKSAKLAHLVVFNENRPASMNRIDFALIAFDESGPLAYGTFREIDNESLYMQYGGAFPSIKGTHKSYQVYSEVLEYLKGLGYKRANTLIENENVAMLKLAMKKGLRIIGVRCFEGKIYCELLINFI